MDVALLNLLEDRFPTPPVAADDTVRRLRQLWLAGMPLARAATCGRVCRWRRWPVASTSKWVSSNGTWTGSASPPA